MSSVFAILIETRSPSELARVRSAILLSCCRFRHSPSELTRIASLLQQLLSSLLTQGVARLASDSLQHCFLLLCFVCRY